MQRMKATSQVPEKDQVQTPNMKVIYCLAVVFSLLLMAITVDAILVDKALLRQILQFVQYVLMAILVIAGGKAARGLLGR